MPHPLNDIIFNFDFGYLCISLYPIKSIIYKNFVKKFGKTGGTITGYQKKKFNTV